MASSILPIFVSVIFVLSLLFPAAAHSHPQAEITSKIDATKITYGSTIRIKAVPFNY
jgi:hypothetical protein